jgi:glucuronate isomerase
MSDPTPSKLDYVKCFAKLRKRRKANPKVHWIQQQLAINEIIVRETSQELVDHSSNALKELRNEMEEAFGLETLDTIVDRHESLSTKFHQPVDPSFGAPRV